ncbi:unnamed protein product [Cyclocybe aegerita]|uniref:ubiquitinyl hydrolase 1 n=1 Tax=Cyclocybe aegerita TaxID=1973307 RepID=A0A8S0W9U6_CYCAE|nr:unnamed protein product [Cyclocybe aegerita]
MTQTPDPSLPPTPRAIRKPKELPLDSDTEDFNMDTDSELPPLHLPSASSLLTFSGNDELSDLTPAQLYEMNQQLMNDSVPTRPLIDAVAPMSTLRSEYENGSAAFLNEIDWLIANGYDSVRRTRGDGDCFYRSLGFAYVESFLSSLEKDFAVASSLSILSGTTEIVSRAGIEKMVYEDFYEQLVSLIQSVVTPDSHGLLLTSERLLAAFQEAEVSNSIVMYLRFLTAAQIRLHREDYEGFVVHPDTKEIMDVDSFCAQFVETMGKEADNVEIQALSSALHLNLDLAYLNGVRTSGVDFIPFRNDPDNMAKPLVLLYRPGHYDILVHNTR